MWCEGRDKNVMADRFKTMWNVFGKCKSTLMSKKTKKKSKNEELRNDKKKKEDGNEWEKRNL